MKTKIIKAFLEWLEEYKIEDYRIQSCSCDEDSKIYFYIYKSEVTLKVDILNKNIYFSFDESFLEDEIILELANLCSRIRNVLGQYNF